MREPLHIERRGWTDWKSWPWNRYIAEGLALALFMVSACLFATLLEDVRSPVRQSIPISGLRNSIMGLAMGLTALGIFYAPFTQESGAHMNPAVSWVFWLRGQLCTRDLFAYVLFQSVGGILAVGLMISLLGSHLTDLPVNYVVTVPQAELWKAILTETLIAWMMMSWVLISSTRIQLRPITRPVAAWLVMMFVIFAGPVSGFGMNPARTLSSAVWAGNYEHFFWYLFCPMAGMGLALLPFRVRMQQASGKIRPNQGLQNKI